MKVLRCEPERPVDAFILPDWSYELREGWAFVFKDGYSSIEKTSIPIMAWGKPLYRIHVIPKK